MVTKYETGRPASLDRNGHNGNGHMQHTDLLETVARPDTSHRESVPMPEKFRLLHKTAIDQISHIIQNPDQHTQVHMDGQLTPSHDELYFLPFSDFFTTINEKIDLGWAVKRMAEKWGEKKEIITGINKDNAGNTYEISSNGILIATVDTYNTQVAIRLDYENPKHTIEKLQIFLEVLVPEINHLEEEIATGNDQIRKQTEKYFEVLSERGHMM